MVITIVVLLIVLVTVFVVFYIQETDIEGNEKDDRYLLSDEELHSMQRLSIDFHNLRTEYNQLEKENDRLKKEKKELSSEIEKLQNKISCNLFENFKTKELISLYEKIPKNNDFKIVTLESMREDINDEISFIGVKTENENNEVLICPAPNYIIKSTIEYLYKMNNRYSDIQKVLLKNMKETEKDFNVFDILKLLEKLKPDSEFYINTDSCLVFEKSMKIKLDLQNPELKYQSESFINFIHEIVLKQDWEKFNE